MTKRETDTKRQKGKEKDEGKKKKKSDRYIDKQLGGI